MLKAETTMVSNDVCQIGFYLENIAFGLRGNRYNFRRENFGLENYKEQASVLVFNAVVIKNRVRPMLQTM